MAFAVLGLLERVFLHAAGQQAVDAVKAYLQEQRVTCLRWVLVLCRWLMFHLELLPSADVFQ